MEELDYARLRRFPDIEAPNLAAYDATDRYLLDLAGDAGLLQDTVAVVGDRHGALTLGALASGAEQVLVHQDGIVSERALKANADAFGVAASRFTQLPLTADVIAGADAVLMQLPRSLDALDELAQLLAAAAHPETVLLAGGRVKHMTRAMNDVLQRYFGSVQPLHARQKSRILRVTQPKLDTVSSWPKVRHHELFDVTLVAYGAAFGGSALDPGATVLLEQLDRMRQAERAIDLGCGNGVLSAVLALRRPDVAVLATDVSHAAVRSALLTAEANKVADRVTVRRADGLEGVEDKSAELILLNPPFHLGATVHTGMAERLITDAGRALAQGGELWCVWNSHLRYRSLLEGVGPTEQVSRNPSFTVTVTRK